MTTAKEIQLKIKYGQEHGSQKKTLIDLDFMQVTKDDGEQVCTDYYKMMTLDFYLFLLDQIPD